jgi:TPR repeat protein/V8-like Glu-specific endopeptidase
LGVLYDNGTGVEKDLTKADEWYRKAVAGHQRTPDKQENAFADLILQTAQYHLGVMYASGNDVPKDPVVAAQWFAKAAESNTRGAWDLGEKYADGDGVLKDPWAAVHWMEKAAEKEPLIYGFNLALRLAHGKGVDKNLPKAAYWYRKAAEQGNAVAQNNLGVMYGNGEVVIKDEIEELAWYYLAKSNGSEEAAGNVAYMESWMGRDDVLLAQQRGREIARGIEAKRIEAQAQSVQSKPVDVPDGSGTGVFISRHGLILTAAHIVGEAKSVKVRTVKGLTLAKVLQSDPDNDIAILKCEGRFTSLKVADSASVCVGQTVFTIGFPQATRQGFNPEYTRGKIRSQTGIQEDPRYWQISVPVQPGNSGEPLLNEVGDIVGIVVARLNAVAITSVAGSVPQDVNYAVKSTCIRPLLEEYGVDLSATSRVTNAWRQFIYLLSEGLIDRNTERSKESIVMILAH